MLLDNLGCPGRFAPGPEATRFALRAVGGIALATRLRCATP